MCVCECMCVCVCFHLYEYDISDHVFQFFFTVLFAFSSWAATLWMMLLTRKGKFHEVKTSWWKVCAPLLNKKWDVCHQDDQVFHFVLGQHVSFIAADMQTYLETYCTCMYVVRVLIVFHGSNCLCFFFFHPRDAMMRRLLTWYLYCYSSSEFTYQTGLICSLICYHSTLYGSFAEVTFGSIYFCACVFSLFVAVVCVFGVYFSKK